MEGVTRSAQQRRPPALAAEPIAAEALAAPPMPGAQGSDDPRDVEPERRP